MSLKRNLKVKEFLLSEVYYQILPFRVWNHLFFCERPQFCVDMCRSCTKFYVSNKRISDHINDNLDVEINHFPIQISEGIVLAMKIYLFAHTNIVSSREDPFGLNLGGFYYKSVTSSFLLWKAYLDILVRIVFNLSYKGLYFCLFQILAIVRVEILWLVILRIVGILF